MRDASISSAQTARGQAAERNLDRLGVNCVPNGWRLSSVGEACVVRNDLRLPLSVETRSTMQGEYPYFGPTGVIDYLDEFRVEGEFALIGEDGDHFLDTKKKRQTVRVSGRFNVNNHAHLIESGTGCSVDWFCYFFQHRDISHSLTRQGAGRYKLTKQALEKLPILLPPRTEQRKISAILRTWDEALEKLNALRAAKARQLDGVAARLIHDEQVERLHLREFLRESSTRNRDEQVQRVLSVTNSAGFVLAVEQFAHRVASASLSNYKIVRHGQYAYNPSRINVGSIARLDAWDEGALSPMYVVFQVQGGLDADFFGHWLRSAEARQRIALAAQGSVRETVSFGDLGSILVPVPTMERQKAIAKGLNAAQAEISLLDDEIKAVTRQKRGLMQKLLKGEWRVEVSDDEEAAA